MKGLWIESANLVRALRVRAVLVSSGLDGVVVTMSPANWKSPRGSAGASGFERIACGGL